MLSQLMHTFTTKIDDWLDRKLNRVDPWLQQQATDRLNEYREILEKGGECLIQEYTFHQRKSLDRPKL